MHSLTHLNSLAEFKSYRNIKFLTPAVSPGNHCPMRFASVIVEDIRGLSSLLIGTAECATHSRMFTPSSFGKQGDLHWTYVLEEKEIIFGCKKGIVDSVLKMAEHNIKHILLIFTCIPELIGEDPQEIVSEIQSKADIYVSHVMLGQFKNVSYPPGSRNTLQALSDFMIPHEKTKTVNLLGIPKDSHIPKPDFTKDLVKEGYKINYIAPDMDINNITLSTEARLNIVLSPYTQPLADMMKEKFDIPYISLQMAFSFEDIQKSLLAIEEILGIQLKVDRQKEHLIELEHYAEKKLKDMKFVIGQRVDLPIPICSYLVTLSLEPLMIHVEDYYSENKLLIARILEKADPLVFRCVNIKKDTLIFNDMDIDLGIGYFYGEDFPVIPNMFDYYGEVGYNRSIKFINKILKTLKLEEGKYGATQI